VIGGLLLPACLVKFASAQIGFGLGGLGVIMGGRSMVSTLKIKNSAGQRVPFVIKNKPKLEMLNGKLNIAFTSTKNQQVQINGIREVLLTDTVLKDGGVQVLYLTRNQVTTWASDSSLHRSTLIISEPKYRGSRASITINARVYLDSEEYTVEAEVNEFLPKSQYQSTR
jgi:hypothetical protein